MKIDKVINKNQQQYAICAIIDNDLQPMTKSFSNLKAAKRAFEEVFSSEDLYLVKAVTSFTLLDSKATIEDEV